MKKAKMTQAEALDIVIADLQSWADSGGDESDDGMLYALRNGYRLHAAQLWLGTGAASETRKMTEATSVLRISRKAEDREIDQICREAHIYECPDCNHNGFRDDDQGESISCFSCGETAFKQARPEEVISKVQELFPESQALPYARKYKAAYVHAEDNSSGFRVVVVPCTEFRDRQGIHLVDLTTEELERKLSAAAESCDRDGFETVWVHVIGA
ncbi:MAG: hypothetical protein KF767_08935 [Bdellovibrionaceae bacterium]|nr:hypothetical protein [Pseudobdellovibrionaceae bacterium]